MKPFLSMCLDMMLDETFQGQGLHEPERSCVTLQRRDFCFLFFFFNGLRTNLWACYRLNWPGVSMTRIPLNLLQVTPSLRLSGAHAHARPGGVHYSPLRCPACTLWLVPRVPRRSVSLWGLEEHRCILQAWWWDMIWVSVFKFFIKVLLDGIYPAGWW